ncbi:hydroxymethylglutaryl-CoA lyase [Candidatus Litorirhabdus singularis]|uniref:hydroxymethylglutaryl-CoA lyase n=1 Tax=Candidatus Litorirhabdus singularis TaxID=2518993 RepID=UPI00242EA07D|nr:hydroxymethylglutaryl-CoA lyase [Candidatus Litorirhabdus singularis]
MTINDVGPRDGLQNQSRTLAPAERLRLIEALLAAGLPAIEVGSFVSPKAVPAMAGAAEVVAGLPVGAAVYSALIPNRKGYDLATAAGVTQVELVVAASQTMNRENINATTEAAMAGCEDIVTAAQADGVKTLACIATAWECPFEGVIDQDVVLGLARDMFAHGADEVVLADTIGAADPAGVKRLTQLAAQEFGADRLSCHFHDTRGMGVANVAAALESGIRKFDASIGGLGGCPFAPGATGNVATEDVALMLGQMGFTTGIDLVKLVAAVDVVSELVGHPQGGNSIRWLRRQIEKGTL